MAETRDGTRTCKGPGPARICHPVQLAELEGKMDQNIFILPSVFDFVLVVVQRGGAPAGEVAEVQGGFSGSAQWAFISLIWHKGCF